MNTLQKQYYYDMAKKDRLFLFYHNERKICLITFYIDNDSKKYAREDMWSVLEDKPLTGTICIIDHLLTDKISHKENHKLTYLVWHHFKEHIKRNFSQVEKILWIRVKINPISLKRERKVYIKSLKGRFAKCI